MRIQVLRYRTVGAPVFRAPLPGRVEARLVRTPGRVGKIAILAARYGSLDLWFRSDGRSWRTPPGVAHFLEHQLFKKHGGDALMEFSRFGASSNAFTDHALTAYYFTTSENFPECLGELVRLVLRPEFARGRVEREKRIIEQELLMYQDMPEVRGLMGLLQGLYHRHPIRLEIGGTVEGVRAVTPEILTLCYRNFYRPSNLILVMAGDLDPQAVFVRAAGLLKACGAASRGSSRASTEFPEEPASVREPQTQIRLPVPRPRIWIGYKDSVGPETPQERLRAETVGGLAIELLFGRASSFFHRHYQSGLINEELSADYSRGEGYGVTTIQAETDDPEAFERAVEAEIERFRRKGPSPGDLERLRRKYSGRILRAFDSPDGAAFALLESLRHQTEPDRWVEMLWEISPHEVRGFLDGALRPDRRAVCRVLP